MVRAWKKRDTLSGCSHEHPKPACRGGFSALEECRREAVVGLSVAKNSLDRTAHWALRVGVDTISPKIVLLVENHRVRFFRLVLIAHMKTEFGE